MSNGQPGAREQYEHWIRSPEIYSQPKQKEWVAAYDALAARVAELEKELAECRVQLAKK